MSLHVLIAGGGIGGLCLANGLRRTGAEVTVFERDAAIAVRGQGYRLHIDANGDNALRHCLPDDLFEVYRATSNRPAPGIVRVLDHRGRQLSEFTSGDATGTAVNRLTLRQILAHGLDDALRLDAQVTDFAEHDDHVELTCADGSTTTGDVLIAADGINSLVRERMLPSAELTDTGLRCIYGRTPTFPDWLRQGFTAVTGNRGRTMALAVFDPREPITQPFLEPVAEYLMWAVITRKSLGGTEEPTELHRIAGRLVKNWHPDLRNLVDQADVTACLAIPIRTSVPVPPWPTGRVTLLGDAIHAMTPAGGVGANTALRDAALLAERLNSVHNGQTELRPALAGYEIQMRDYGFAAVTASLRGVDMLRRKGVR